MLGMWIEYVHATAVVDARFRPQMICNSNPCPPSGRMAMIHAHGCRVVVAKFFCGYCVIVAAKFHLSLYVSNPKYYCSNVTGM